VLTPVVCPGLYHTSSHFSQSFERFRLACSRGFRQSSLEFLPEFLFILFYLRSVEVCIFQTGAFICFPNFLNVTIHQRLIQHLHRPVYLYIFLHKDVLGITNYHCHLRHFHHPAAWNLNSIEVIVSI
jgi:hypothetical protein